MPKSTKSIFDTKAAALATVLEKIGIDSTAENDVVVSIIEGLTEDEKSTILVKDSMERLVEETLAILDLKKSGKSVWHALGKTNFLGNWFDVRPDVLVPHPATEVFILFIVSILQGLGRQPSIGIEVGLGTGVIAISLLERFPSLRMIGSDISSAALDNARVNSIKRLGTGSDRLLIESCDSEFEILQPFVRAGVAEKSLSLIVTNPPYLLPTDEISVDYRTNMPSAALYSTSDDGLAIYRELAEIGLRWLAPHGVICLEARTARANAVVELFKSLGYQVSCVDKASVSRDTSLDLMSATNAQRQFKNHRYIAAWIA